MGRRIGQVAGIAGLSMVIVRLGRLLQSGPEIVRWELILVASVFLGGVIWWLLDQLSLSRSTKIALFTVAGLVLLVRISVPMTLVGGILPSSETPAALTDEMISAFRIIRSGVPPVLPTEGIVAILAIVMWALGALYSWGLTGGPVIAMTLPGLVVYLQFAVFDRAGAGLGWMILAAGFLVAATTSVALDRRAETGRARDSEGRTLPRRSLSGSLTMAGSVALVGLVAATTLGGLPGEYGNIPWRSGGNGFGGEGGRISFDRFADLRQRLIDRSNQVVFRATLGDGAPPAETLYWRLETLDVFDGVAWSRSSGSIRNYEAGEGVGADYLRYQGTTTDVLQMVQIQALAETRVPTAGVATEIHQLSNRRAIDPPAFRVAQDSSVVYPPMLREGDIYQLRASYPDYVSDLGVLASNNTGELSPMFAGAAADGLFPVVPESRDLPIDVPPDLDFYTLLPEDLPASLRGIAVSVTRGASTDFEQAWMLEYWFRDSGSFVYSTDVSTGHDALRLDDWLSDPTSDNYRTGYCEQFAVAMAVLGRELGIPSRLVLGFTPGEVTPEGVIQVRDTNAHLWVEMWMPEVGWVQFDPTPRGEFQPPSLTAGFDPDEFVDDPGFPDALTNPISPPDAGNVTGIQDIPPATGGQIATRWWPLVALALSLLVALVPMAKRIRRGRRLRRARSGDITAVWEEIVDRLVDLGEPVPSSLTPMEVARATDDALLPLAVGYSAAIYGGRQGEGSELDLLTAEGWISTKYDTGRRLRASLSTRSLLDR